MSEEPIYSGYVNLYEAIQTHFGFSKRKTWDVAQKYWRLLCPIRGKKLQIRHLKLAVLREALESERRKPRKKKAITSGK
jgi:hypothetical protein